MNVSSAFSILRLFLYIGDAFSHGTFNLVSVDHLSEKRGQDSFRDTLPDLLSVEAPQVLNGDGIFIAQEACQFLLIAFVAYLDEKLDHFGEVDFFVSVCVH